MPVDLQSPEPKPSLSGARHADRLRMHWKSIVALGIAMGVLGVVALLLSVSATIVSVLLIGILMCLAGTTQVVVGFRTRTWGRFLAFEAAGLLYVVVGLFAVFSPVEASVVLTLLLGAGLIATAVSRLYLASQMKGSPRRTTLAIAALATGILGVLIVANWPTNSLFVLGTLLGIDLVFQGVAWTALGLKVKPTS